MMKFIDHQTKLLPALVGSTINSSSFEVIHHPLFTNILGPTNAKWRITKKGLHLVPRQLNTVYSGGWVEG